MNFKKKFNYEQNVGNPFSQLEIRSVIGREVGSHDVWSYDQSKDRPTSHSFIYKL